jgi:hypothetical protein
MFRTLIYPSSGAWDCVNELPHRSKSIKIHLPTTTKRQNTSHQTHTSIRRKFTLTLNHPSLQNKTINVVIQQHSRKLRMMDILMSETC